MHGVTPATVQGGADVCVATWRCDCCCKHCAAWCSVWQAILHHRASHRSISPYCCGCKVCACQADYQHLRQELVKESEMAMQTGSLFTGCCSKANAIWMCPEQGAWTVQIDCRVSFTGCLGCAKAANCAPKPGGGLLPKEHLKIIASCPAAPNTERRPERLADNHMWQCQEAVVACAMTVRKGQLRIRQALHQTSGSTHMAPQHCLIRWLKACKSPPQMLSGLNGSLCCRRSISTDCYLAICTGTGGAPGSHSTPGILPAVLRGINVLATSSNSRT